MDNAAYIGTEACEQAYTADLSQTTSSASLSNEHSLAGPSKTLTSSWVASSQSVSAQSTSRQTMVQTRFSLGEFYKPKKQEKR